MNGIAKTPAVVRALTRRAALAVPMALLYLCAANTAAPASAAFNTETTPEIRQRAFRSLGQTPLSFEANEGQFAEPVEYVARGPGYDIFLTADETVFSLSRVVPNNVGAGEPATGAPSEPQQTEQIAVRMKLDGAGKPSAIVPEQKQDWRANYFIGNDRSKWRTGVPAYARVRYEEIYPGINVEYYGNQGRLEYDFVVAPGADPDVIALSFDGAEDLSVDKDGNLILHVPGGRLVQHAPIIYQETDGEREPVAGRYTLRTDGKVGFQLAAYDPTRPLIIDPVLEYGTFLGSPVTERTTAIAVDGAGAAYVTLFSRTTGFPASSVESEDYHGVVVKLAPDGSSLAYVTYLSGSKGSFLYDIAVDEAGAAYIVGETLSGDFATTAGAFQESSASAHLGFTDAVFAKLDANGSDLLYSTYLGGNRPDRANAVTLDSSGMAYIAGRTTSEDFPITIGTSHNRHFNVFIAKFDASGPGLIYSRTLGGSRVESPLGIAVDSSGATYITGVTQSTDFPVTAGAAQTTLAGRIDGFVLKLDSSGNNIIYSTFMGGTGFERGRGIAVDSAGAAYITGDTDSPDFPLTADAFHTGINTFDGSPFVAKIDPTGSSFEYSTSLGGGALSFSIALDANNSAYVTGYELFDGIAAITPDALFTARGFGLKSFIVQLDASGSLIYGTYLGSEFSLNFATDLALDPQGAIYVAGYTRDSGFPVTEGAYQTTGGGTSEDGYVVKLGPDNQPPVADAGPDQVVEASSADGANVTLDGSASSDSDGDPLTYTWSGPFGTASGVSPAIQVPLGVHVITLEVNDGTDTASDTVQITVQDTTPPVVTPPADITAEAEGLLTAVDLGTATANDLVDGALTPTPDTTGPFAPGTHTVTWSATDAAGNTGTVTQKVSIRYIFNGFHQPVDNLPTINTAKAGQMVPVKWSVPTPGGGYFRDTSIVTSLQMAPVSCDADGTVPEDAVEAEGTGNAGLRYDETNEHFIFNWKTPKDLAGNCQLFILNLNDGSQHTAKFKLK